MGKETEYRVIDSMVVDLSPKKRKIINANREKLDLNMSNEDILKAVSKYSWDGDFEKPLNVELIEKVREIIASVRVEPKITPLSDRIILGYQLIKESKKLMKVEILQNLTYEELDVKVFGERKKIGAIITIYEREIISQQNVEPNKIIDTINAIFDVYNLAIGKQLGYSA